MNAAPPLDLGNPNGRPPSAESRLAVDREPCPLRVCIPPLGLSGCVVKLIGERKPKWLESGLKSCGSRGWRDSMGIGTEAERGTGSTWRPSLGEAPAPAHWLNLPRLTQPLPGMGGGVVHEGRGKSGQGWGVGGARKGES